MSRQAKLISKLASYDRNFRKRAGKEARILVVFADDDVDSRRTARQVVAALRKEERVGGLPHVEISRRFRGAGDLASQVVDRRISIVYLCPGLLSYMEEVADALIGKDVMTVGSRGAYARLRAAVAFDLVSGKPKLIVHLPQAEQQNVKFATRLLKLAEVIR